MYWNALAYNLKLEEAFNLVCDNNLEKFVLLESWNEAARPLESAEWHCNLNIAWPPEVVSVEILKIGGNFFAVGKDQHGKVRKPSSFRPVDLSGLV